jgi:hypothetical protein
MGFTKGHGGANFFCGSYNTAWFYAESLEEILPKAEGWADALDAKRKAKAKTKVKA